MVTMTKTSSSNTDENGHLVILHLSDLHFGNRDARNEMGRISEALIAAAHLSEIKPDLCVFSGDMAFSGSQAEFALGTKWLETLMKPWPETKLFVVPGNHDVVRLEAKMLLRQVYETEQVYDKERSNLTLTLQHLENFQKWARDLRGVFGDRMLSDWEDLFISKAAFSKNGRTIRLIGLNTALLSCLDDDMNKLVQDVSALNGALPSVPNSSDAIIVIGHHPLNWLAPWNSAEVGRLLKQVSGAHLYMHGHRHETSALSFASGTGERLTTLESGAAYQGSNWPQYFAFHELKFSLREIQPVTFALAPSSGKWIVDSELSESFVAPIPGELPPAEAKEKAHPAEARPAREGVKDVNQQHSDDEAPGDPSRDRIELEAHRIVNAAQKIHPNVVLAMDGAIAKSVQLYRYQNRIKEVDSIIRKVSSRINRGESTYGVGSLEDVCGLRYSVLFQSDLPVLIERLLEVAFQKSPRSIFRAQIGAKVTIHTSRPEKDPLAVTKAVQDVLQRSGVKHAIEVRQRATGYSSVHIVLRHTSKRWDGDVEGMPVEFQLRTGLEEYWGQLDTQLRYKLHRGVVDAAAWQKHLNVLKAQFDAMIQYVDLIRETAENSEASTATKSAMPHTFEQGESSLSFSTAEAIMSELKGLPDDILSRLKEAFVLWEEADAGRQFGGDPNRNRRAADAFEAIRKTDTARIKDRTLRSLFEYSIRMERAYMLLCADDPADVATAGEIYQDILESRPGDPTVQLRLGQVHMHRREFESASQLFEASAESSQKEARNGKSDEMMRIFDYAHLNKGLCNFRIFEGAADIDVRRTAIRNAIMSARIIVETGHSLRLQENALNDMVYYAWEERRLDPRVNLTLSDGDYEKYADRLIELLQTSFKADPDFRLGDTLVRVLVDRGRQEEAKTTAQTVCVLLEKAAKERGGENLLADPTEYGSKWMSKVSAMLRNEDERDAFFYSFRVWDPSP